MTNSGEQPDGSPSGASEGTPANNTGNVDGGKLRYSTGDNFMLFSTQKQMDLDLKLEDALDNARHGGHGTMFGQGMLTSSKSGAPGGATALEKYRGSKGSLDTTEENQMHANDESRAKYSE